MSPFEAVERDLRVEPAGWRATTFNAPLDEGSSRPKL